MFYRIFKVLQSCGDGDVLSALFRILLPVAYQFGPQLIVVAADHSPSGTERFLEFFKIRNFATHLLKIT